MIVKMMACMVALSTKILIMRIVSMMIVSIMIVGFFPEL